MSRDDAYLLDMLVAAKDVRRFCAGVSWDDFRPNEILQHAVARLIQLIGEAARCVSEERRMLHPGIPWRDITGMRHHLVHHYFHVRLERVWDVVVNDIEVLIERLEPLVPPDSSGE